ncbi:MAG: AraC family ligand binding domain-containing protein, partial [Eubacteriales bacterium]|nr:AraC family ligand binding domain-containing protein [Eubacteriales bacterium]
MSRDLFSEEILADKNSHILAHWHEGIELLYIKEGALCCLLQGKEFKLAEGTLCIINQKRVHRIYCREEGDCVFQRLMLDPELFTGDRQICRKYIDPVLSDERFSHIIAPAKRTAVREIVNLMNSIGDLERLKPDAYELVVIACLHMIFQKLFILYQESIGAAASVINTDTVLFRKMADFIYRSYAEKLTLDEIAANGNISR